jgi:hypothetical protein
LQEDNATLLRSLRSATGIMAQLCGTADRKTPHS